MSPEPRPTNAPRRLALGAGRHCPLGLHSAFQVLEGAAIVEFGADSGLVYLREGGVFQFEAGRAPRWIVPDHILIETLADAPPEPHSQGCAGT